MVVRLLKKQSGYNHTVENVAGYPGSLLSISINILYLDVPVFVVFR